MNNELMAALDARDNRVKEQLDQIGRSIGYGRAIQLLGQLWDDMMQASYPQVGRHQEGLHRRSDIERIEAGEPLGRKVVYYQKRGRKGKITALVPIDFVVENVALIVSDTPLYGKNPVAPVEAVDVERDAAIQSVIDHIADNWPMKKYSLEEIETRLRAELVDQSRTNTSGGSDDAR